MTTLEDLYYGNISPHERYIKRGTRVDKLVKLICEYSAKVEHPDRFELNSATAKIEQSNRRN